MESKRKPVEIAPPVPQATPLAPQTEPEAPQVEPEKPVVTKKKAGKKVKKQPKKKLGTLGDLPSLAPLKPGALPGLNKGPGLSRPQTPVRTAYEKAVDFLKLLLQNSNMNEIFTRLSNPKPFEKLDMIDRLGKLDTMREVRLEYEPPIPESVY